jgi:hypothetical protein
MKTETISEYRINPQKAGKAGWTVTDKDGTKIISAHDSRKKALSSVMRKIEISHAFLIVDLGEVKEA